VFNQLYGGKSPPMSLTELKALGVSLVNYSTPCIAAAQSAMFTVMEKLKQQDGLLTEDLAPGVTLKECNNVLHENLKRDLHLK
jgi:2-methylisocitrate lyase-like PEP mutase family enzyme